MKIRIQYKTPDAIYYALKDSGLDPSQVTEDIAMVIAKFTSGNGEYISIELDSDTQTAVVRPQR